MKIFVRYSSLIILFIISTLAQAANPDTISAVNPIVFHVKGKFYSTPANTNCNKVFIASHNKNLYCFDNQGALLNNHKTDGWIHATPAQLSDQNVAVGSYDGHFYFFDNEGVFQKKIKPKGFIFTNPVEFGEEIAFGSNKRAVFYHPEKDTISYLRLRRIAHGSPMVTSDSAFLIIGANSGRLYFINSDKEISHDFKTKGWIMHSQALETYDSLIVVGSYDKHLYAIDKSGEEAWRYKTDGRIHANPLQMPDSSIIFGSFDKHIYILTPDGQLINKIKTEKRVVSSAAMLNDTTAVVGSYDRFLYFVSTTGELLGKYDAQGKIFSSPIVLACGTIFCCTTKGNMHFLPPEYVERLLKKEEKQDDYSSM